MSATQWLWLIVLSILWGGSFFFVGVAVNEVPTLTLVLARVGLAALVLLPILAIVGLRLPHGWTAWQPFVGMAILNNILPFSLIALGQSQIASGLASVLNATTPLWSVVLARLLIGDEKLTSARVGGLVLGVVGVAILMWPALRDTALGSLFGMACVLGGALSYGFAGVWGRRLRSTPPLVSAASQLIASTIMLAPAVAIVDAPWTLSQPSAGTLAALVGLAILSTAVAYIVFFHILSVSGPTNAMLVTLLIPISSIALGALFLGERLLPEHIAGAALVAVALVVFDGRAIGWLTATRSRQP